MTAEIRVRTSVINRGIHLVGGLAFLVPTIVLVPPNPLFYLPGVLLVVRGVVISLKPFLVVGPTRVRVGDGYWFGGFRDVDVAGLADLTMDGQRLLRSSDGKAITVLDWRSGARRSDIEALRRAIADTSEGAVA